MSYQVKYPKLIIDLQKVCDNTAALCKLAEHAGISITGVAKVMETLPCVARKMLESGCHSIASSRMEALANLREDGLKDKLMLLRLPMLSEVDRVVKIVDYSLNSEKVILEALDQSAKEIGKTHGVILMADLGDLREGFIEEKELIATALWVERESDCLYLAGIGTNLGCYGSIKPDVTNLNRLVEIGREIETLIGRKLEIISGGASTSIPLLVDHKMPTGITHLRTGEAILNGKDLPDLWGYPMERFHRDVAILQAEVIEVKDKPSHPIGEIFVDAFGGRPVYEDRGIRKRALLAVGKKDIGHHDSLVPRRSGVEIVGSSSDHLIVDVTEAGTVRVGDILEFELYYQALLYLTASKSVKKEWLNE